MVAGRVLAGPDFLLGPLLIGQSPKTALWRAAKGQEGSGTQIEAAGRDVVLP